MDLGIKGKFALVTGASRGIGRACALALAGEGCGVAICARNPESIREALELLAPFDVPILGIEADLMLPEDCAKVMTCIENQFRTLHILVNNVGGGGRWGHDHVENTEEAVWLEVFEKNVITAVRFTRWALPMMRNQKWGRVVSITSMYGREGGGRPWFNMAKAAQTSMMKCLGMRPELARDNITFNSVAPGPIMIPGTGWEDEQKLNPVDFEAMLDREHVLGRLGNPEEVASAVVFLCSERASLINGASLALDGGDGKSF